MCVHSRTRFSPRFLLQSSWLFQARTHCLIYQIPAVECYVFLSRIIRFVNNVQLLFRVVLHSYSSNDTLRNKRVNRCELPLLRWSSIIVFFCPMVHRDSTSTRAHTLVDLQHSFLLQSIIFFEQQIEKSHTLFSWTIAFLQVQLPRPFRAAVGCSVFSVPDKNGNWQLYINFRFVDGNT